ncbi:MULTISPECIES: DUF3102 domain-containing protein [unclassified Dehalobacter]|uniref:DUF3102 domain-containing protein n=1 Tax=unclassified Dehalobacter TaxID=2635733 RepID=UPI000E6B6183|nr:MULTISPECIES: DUF3102 domain-containing protein [unclassified Dehalobacter]RJE47210.1 preprotein translocase subunit SecA [Dehalobacter sp. MCB1]TCX53544.1 preprotein translocase subunit SecA [Dehalobacter sp. 14DCB1]TCX54929.1 preprotein translocase subunit SecA [Dehalobacter sp. 12DCB1]
MRDLLTERTPPVIAAEINTIKQQTNKILLTSAVEVGKRLKEAKALLPYGEWGKWLEESVSYSQRTADRMMQIFDEYGAKLLVPSEDQEMLDSSPVTNLTYTQALILLGLPVEERDEFIAENDAGSMSSRQLQQAVSVRNQELAGKEDEDLLKVCAEQKDKISKLSDERDQAKKEATDNLQAVWAEQGNVLKLQRKLDVLENENDAAKRIAEIEYESRLLKLNLSMTQADARFELIAKGFEELFIAIKEMAAADPDACKLYITHANQLMSKAMNKLKRIEKTAMTAPKAPENPE